MHEKIRVGDPIAFYYDNAVKGVVVKIYYCLGVELFDVSSDAHGNITVKAKDIYLDKRAKYLKILSNLGSIYT